MRHIKDSLCDGRVMYRNTAAGPAPPIIETKDVKALAKRGGLRCLPGFSYDGPSHVAQPLPRYQWRYRVRRATTYEEVAYCIRALDDTLNINALKPQGNDFPAPVDIKHDDEAGTYFLIPAVPLVEPSMSGYGGETDHAAAARADPARDAAIQKQPDTEAEVPDEASPEVVVPVLIPAVPKVALPTVDTWFPALAISLFSLRQFSEVSDAEDPLSIKHLIRKRRQEVATKSRDEAVKMKTWKLEQRMQVVRAMSQKRQDKEEERRARVDARKVYEVIIGQ
jgi:hypothetical protein